MSYIILSLLEGYLLDIYVDIFITMFVGLSVGDEILVFNGQMVAELDLLYIESLLEECDKANVTVRSCATEYPPDVRIVHECDDLTDSITSLQPCPSGLTSHFSDAVNSQSNSTTFKKGLCFIVLIDYFCTQMALLSYFIYLTIRIS